LTRSKKSSKKHKIEKVIITKNISQSELIQLQNRLFQDGIKDIAIHSSKTQELKELSVEDLLARYPKDLDSQVISDFIQNKTVLITGAGGSIGSEISAKCLKYGAKKLILVDHSEYNLYAIVNRLDSTIVTPVLQSVLDTELLSATFERYRPQIVIHAAAYKHVPLCEQNITEAIKNNIIGTKNTIDLSIQNKVEKFVLISTDKAVRPTNVMGATKRVCELYATNVEPHDTEIVAVRFGNVLNSSGSVIPKFKEQIQNGGPITVTDERITRYFMLISEACELVLQAASLGKGGEIFILDMGEPVKIVELAQKMIELSGKNIAIKFIGLREGEKLYEELLINESDKKTQYDSITVSKPTTYPIETLNIDIHSLVASDDKITDLKNIVKEFTHE
jgi:FlaA1/EpsC-like NDP-sugar epimerase